MDVGEAARRYSELQVQRRNGSLSDQQYRALIDQLRVQDEKGTWWQPDPGGSSWIFWDGTRWHPGTLPPTAPVFSAASPPAPAAMAVSASLQTGNKLMDTGTFRKIARTTPWHQRPQKWWDLFAILIGIASAAIWLVYSGAPKTSEGVDLLSPLLMIGIPVILVTYRAEIDKHLIPLQPHRHKFSKIFLIGMSIAVPFLTAFILFNVARIQNYPLMHWNLVLGTVVSYAIMREPVLAPGYQPIRGPNLKVPILLILLCSFLVRIVSADHCLADPLNAQDCARSSGFAEGISGTPPSAIGAGANGQDIVRNIRQGPNYAPPSAPGTTSGAGSAATGASSSVAPGLPSTATPEQIAQQFIASQQYARGNWHVSRDSTGTATGVYLDIGFWNRPGATPTTGSTSPTRFTTTHIPLSELQTNQLFSTPVDTARQQQIASQAAQSLTTADVTTLVNQPRYNALSDPDKRALIQRVADGISHAQGIPSVPVTYSTTIPYEAQYDPGSSTIEINPGQPIYNNRTELIKAISHEVKHAGQRSNQGLGTAAPAVQFNNANYITPTTDPSRYVSQIKERDSINFENAFIDALRARRARDRSVPSTTSTTLGGGP